MLTHNDVVSDRALTRQQAARHRFRHDTDRCHGVFVRRREGASGQQRALDQVEPVSGGAHDTHIYQPLAEAGALTP